MQESHIINEFTTLLHKHGPDSDEVESFLLAYDHLDSFMSRAAMLRNVFREKDEVTQIHL